MRYFFILFFLMRMVLPQAFCVNSFVGKDIHSRKAVEIAASTADLKANIGDIEYINEDNDVRFVINYTAHSFYAPSFCRRIPVNIPPEKVYCVEIEPGGRKHFHRICEGSSIEFVRDMKYLQGARYYILFEGSYFDNGRYIRYVQHWYMKSDIVSVPVYISKSPVLKSDKNEILVGENLCLKINFDGGARIYEIVSSISSDFSSGECSAYWPSAGFENITVSKAGKYYFRARAWDKLPEEGGICSAWSNVLEIKVKLSAPYLFPINRPVFNSEYEISWADSNNNRSEGAIFEVIETNSGNNDISGKRLGWTKNLSYPISNKPGVYRYCVKSWNAMPEDGGVPSDCSNPIEVKVLSKAEFLDMIEERCFYYMLDSTYSNGLTRDRWKADFPAPDDNVSVSATGFYLSALTVGAERGWISKTDAEKKALITLNTLLHNVPVRHGFFKHFMTSGGQDTEFNCEYSTIDTAIVLAGALNAGEYFGGEVKERAKKLYDRVDWGYMFNWYNYLFHMGCGDYGNFLGLYDSYSEAVLLYILAIGSKTHPVPAYSFYNFSRRKRHFGNGKDFIFTFGGQLFTYQFPQLWVDFKGIKDGLGVDWYENSKSGVIANYDYAVSMGGEFGYSGVFWGISPCDGPDASYHSYGAKPSLWENEHDGTVAPYSVISSINYVEDKVVNTLANFYNNYGGEVWKNYGFVDGINNVKEWMGDRWYVGIDKGASLLALENYRSGLIWEYFMRNEFVINALVKMRFSGYSENYNIIEGFEGNSCFKSWNVSSTDVYNLSLEKENSHGGFTALKINYDKKGDMWACVEGEFNDEYRDLSGKDKLIFWANGYVKLLVKLEDGSCKGVDLLLADSGCASKQVAGGYGWTYFEYDLKQLNGIIDKSDIRRILFFIAPSETNVSGTLYLDDIIIE